MDADQNGVLARNDLAMATRSSSSTNVSLERVITVRSPSSWSRSRTRSAVSRATVPFHTGRPGDARRCPCRRARRR